MSTERPDRESGQRAWEALLTARYSPRVQQWLSEADALEEERRRTRAKRWAVAAGVAVAALGLGVVAYLRSAVTVYETQIGEQRDVVLADGSRVTLNTNTSVSVRYSKQRRLIELTRGEALFSVKHDAERPFDVVARNVLARALGTEFNVDLRHSIVTVSVLEGAVRVTPAASASAGLESATEGAGGANTLVPTALGKGQALEVLGKEHRVVAEKADRRRIDAWRARRLEFNDTPLSTAVAEFNRYSEMRVVIGTPDLGDVRVSGVFRIGDAEGFLFSLREALNIETHGTQGGVVLMRAAQ